MTSSPTQTNLPLGFYADSTTKYIREKPKEIFFLIKIVCDWANLFFESREVQQLSSWSGNIKSAFALPGVMENAVSFGKLYYSALSHNDIDRYTPYECISGAFKVGQNGCEMLRLADKFKVIQTPFNSIEFDKAKALFTIGSTLLELSKLSKKVSEETAPAENAGRSDQMVNGINKRITRIDIIRNATAVVANVVLVASIVSGIAASSLFMLCAGTVIITASIAIHIMKEEVNALNNVSGTILPL